MVGQLWPEDKCEAFKVMCKGMARWKARKTKEENS
jgi:hypothetical protein